MKLHSNTKKEITLTKKKLKYIYIYIRNGNEKKLNKITKIIYRLMFIMSQKFLK